MSLFQLGKFILASGQESRWKLEADALDDGDWECLAYLGSQIVPAFGSVVGVPRGGLAFARAMEKYATSGPRLVVDDVFTTGGSLRKILEAEEDDGFFALVAFARKPPPSWLYAVWTMRPFLQYSEKTGDGE